MKLPYWKAIAGSALLCAAVTLAGCKKNNDETPFSYSGNWATAKVMNADVTSETNAQKSIKGIVFLIEQLIDGKITTGAEKVKETAKTTIASTIELLRGVKINVRNDGQACTVSFAGLRNGIDGTWQAHESTLNTVPPETLALLQRDASIKGKINYAFATGISGKTISLSRKGQENILEWTLDPKILNEILATNSQIPNLASLLGSLSIGKNFPIEFHKVD